MITTAFLILATYVISIIFSVFPGSSGFSSTIVDSFASVGSYITLINTIVNMSVLASAVALVFSVEIAIFSFKAIRSLITHVPLVGGKG